MSISVLYEIFLPCFYSTQLSSASEDLLTAAYSSEWYKIKDLKFRKSFIILRENAIKELKFSFAWLDNNMMTFSSIIQSAYSYYSLLRSLNKLSG